MDIVLSRDELRQVTGSRTREGMRLHLRALGIPHHYRADGWPVVDRRAYYEHMGAEAANEPEAVLDWGAL